MQQQQQSDVGRKDQDKQGSIWDEINQANMNTVDVRGLDGPIESIVMPHAQKQPSSNERVNDPRKLPSYDPPTDLSWILSGNPNPKSARHVRKGSNEAARVFPKH